MIHYGNGTWTSKTEKRDIAIIRKHGRESFERRMKFRQRVKKALLFYKLVFIRTITLFFFPIKLLYKKHKYKKLNAEKLAQITNDIEKIKDARYIVFCRGDWLGVSSATQALFHNVVFLPDLTRYDDFEAIAKKISD